MKYENEQFVGGSIQLDGNEFRGCEFRDCQAVFAGGELPDMSDCSFYQVNFVLDGPALQTAQFFAMFAGTQFGDVMLQQFFGMLSRGLVPGQVDVHRPHGATLN